MKNSLRDLFNGFQLPRGSMKCISQRIPSFKGLLRVCMVLVIMMWMMVIMMWMVVVMGIMILVVMVTIIIVCIVDMIVPPSPAQSGPYFDPPTLRTT